MDVQTLYLCPPNQGPIIRTDNGYQVCGGVGQVSEVIPERILPEGITHYESAAIFYEREILPLNPRVIGWGEVHAEPVPQNPPHPISRYTPSIYRLVNEFLPTIASTGQNALILEAIPPDRDVKREILRFFQDSSMTISQNDTPLLWDAVQGVDRDGYILLFNEARRLNVQIVGGGLTIDQAKRTIRLPDYRDRYTLHPMTMRQVTINMRRAAAEQLRLNPRTRLHLYGGCIHNNRQVTERHIRMDINFGRDFIRYFGDRYVEIDLIYPHPAASGCTEGLLPTPRSGVNVRLNGPSSFTVFSPGD